MAEGKTFHESLTPEQLKKLDDCDGSFFESLTPEQREKLDEEFEAAMTPGQREDLERMMRGEPLTGGFEFDPDELADPEKLKALTERLKKHMEENP